MFLLKCLKDNIHFIIVHLSQEKLDNIPYCVVVVGVVVYVVVGVVVYVVVGVVVYVVVGVVVYGVVVYGVVVYGVVGVVSV